MSPRIVLLRILFACAVAMLALSGCSSSTQPTVGPATTALSPAITGQNVVAGYKVGSGDELHITVFGQKNLSGDFKVDGTGNISFPLIGTVNVGGKTAGEISNALVSKLSPEYLINPRVTVEVIKYRPFYVLGEVQKPGSYPYVSGMTVLQAVALANGFTPRADQDEVTVIRASDPHRKEQKASLDSPVYPGDIIRVPEIFF